MDVTDSDRMRMALELTRDHPSPEAEALSDRRRSDNRKIVTIGLVIALVIGAVVGVLLATADRPWSRSSVPAWRHASGLILFAVGFVAMVLGIVRTPRDQRFGRAIRRRNRPLEVLARSQRKLLLHQVQGKSRVVPEHLLLTRLVARSLLGTPGNRWTLAGVSALFVGNLLRSDSVGLMVLSAFLLVLMVVAVPYATGQARRARAFLDAHPEPTPETVP